MTARRGTPGRQRPRTKLVLAVFAISACLVVLVPTLRAQAIARAMTVTVVDEAGAPIPDLGPSDFIVREDNVSREVLRVGPADEPMQIALLVDTSTA